jgi:surface antigen
MDDQVARYSSPGLSQRWPQRFFSPVVACARYRHSMFYNRAYTQVHNFGNSQTASIAERQCRNAR